MDEIKLAKEILNKIIVEDVPFALAIKNAYKKENVEPASRGNITALLGCELRHHLLLDNLLTRYFDGVEFEKTIYLRFLICNKLFLRRFDDKILISLVNAELDKDRVKEVLDFIISTNEIIPNDYDKSSPEYLSLRFNTPAWVIRMWQKQYGKGVVFKVLKTNYRSSVPSIRVNTNYLNTEDFLVKHPDFVKSSIDDVIIYSGRGNCKGLDEFKDNKIFFMKMATKHVMDALNIEPIKRIAIFSDVPNNIYLDLVARFGEKVEADVIIHHTQSYYETKKVTEKNGYFNIHLYNAEASSIITCISKKVGTMIVLPKSTTFDLLRSTPDYFLRIKQDKLDEIIEGEMQALEEAAKVVELDGNLVYLIPTISKKESTNLIANFLFKHKEFSLVEDKQFFPFENYDSCLYYAILKRVGSNSD